MRCCWTQLWQSRGMTIEGLPHSRLPQDASIDTPDRHRSVYQEPLTKSGSKTRQFWQSGSDK
jgi:hypothetical protein